LSAAARSGVIGAMTTTNGFLPSCWLGRAGLGRARGEQRERRLATTAQRSGADDARRRLARRRLGEGGRQGAARDAQRSGVVAAWVLRSAAFSRRGRRRAAAQPGTRWSKGPAASAPAADLCSRCPRTPNGRSWRRPSVRAPRAPGLTDPAAGSAATAAAGRSEASGRATRPRLAELARPGRGRLSKPGTQPGAAGPPPVRLGGHDSRTGSAADGPRDVPARVLQERRFVRDSSRTGRRRWGRCSPDGAQAEEDAGLVISAKESATPALARDVPLGSAL